jgi:hypothetical protein
LHFDGSGNVTGSVSEVAATSGGLVNGTYSVNPDGTGQVQLTGIFTDHLWQFIIQDKGDKALFIDPDQNVYVGGELYPTVGDLGTIRKQRE